MLFAFNINNFAKQQRIPYVQNTFLLPVAKVADEEKLIAIIKILVFWKIIKEWLY